MAGVYQETLGFIARDERMSTCRISTLVSFVLLVALCFPLNAVVSTAQAVCQDVEQPQDDDSAKTPAQQI